MRFHVEVHAREVKVKVQGETATVRVSAWHDGEDTGSKWSVSPKVKQQLSGDKVWEEGRRVYPYVLARRLDSLLLNLLKEERWLSEERQMYVLGHLFKLLSEEAEGAQRKLLEEAEA